MNIQIMESTYSAMIIIFVLVMGNGRGVLPSTESDRPEKYMTAICQVENMAKQNRYGRGM